VNTQEAIAVANQVLYLAGQDEIDPRLGFLEFSYIVADAARELTQKQRAAIPHFVEWAYSWRKLHDEFDKLVTADPMLQYRPANRASLAFHSSTAYVRYFRAGNRTSKTQSGYAEHYLITTGQHRWRSFGPPPGSTFVIGTNYAHYAGAVFEKKFITGEDDNPLSPMFPEGGKWLNHYDPRKHVVTIACPACAEVGKSLTCPHPKSSIRLFSDESGYKVLMGGQYIYGHFDEHIDEEFFNEAQQRTKTVTGGCLAVTGTPLYGPHAWEQRLLDDVFLAGGTANRVDPSDPKSAAFVEVFTIDQFEAGLVPHHIIRGDMERMDEAERESRIFGRPGALAKNPVFDRLKLIEARKVAKPGERGFLQVTADLEREDKNAAATPVAKFTANTQFSLTEDATGPLQVWEHPQAGCTYVLAVDTASGLLAADASCAMVLKVSSIGPQPVAQVVAQWHGRLNPFDYAVEVFKLAIHYNSALVVVELTGGFGHSVMLKLKNEFYYWNLYRDTNEPAVAQFNLDPRFGIDTNQSTKPRMIGALQFFIKNGHINIPCPAAIAELLAYEQTMEGKGGVALAAPKFQGGKGSHDDRVMALAIGTWVISASPTLLFQVKYATVEKLDKAKIPEHAQDWHELGARKPLKEQDPFDAY
jgi:hypothetical protein